MSELYRITLNLTPKGAHALAEASELNEETRTASINRAVQIYDLLTREVAQGSKLIIQRADGTVSELLIVT